MRWLFAYRVIIVLNVCLFVSVFLVLHMLWILDCWRLSFHRLSIIQTLILFRILLVTQWSVSGKIFLCVFAQISCSYFIDCIWTLLWYLFKLVSYLHVEVLRKHKLPLRCWHYGVAFWHTGITHCYCIKIYIIGVGNCKEGGYQILTC